jgi:effector-binding domain-containing protein
MTIEVSVETARPRILAAVRRTVAIGEVGAAFRPALDQVWQFLRGQPGLRTDGHNIFLYHHPARRDLPMEVDFGVEVTRTFAPSGEVYPTETPAGEIAVAVHVGPYERMRETHDAIHAWAAANRRAFAGKSWEIYGDPTDDPAKLETTIVYLLR